ncbi:hypothetical protein niasHT_020858 [Heterodera trifolii]|uniref:Uncharacterized protein n=1 Tax=Heterodera trifolii TaxID=157864 RepID=A0ABD2KLK8_9BILA
MTTRLRRFAICAGVDEENGTCLMVYENDLNAIEVRMVFTGVKIGKWYRFDLAKGTRRNWEVAEERLPTRIMQRRDAGSGGTRGDRIQLCLPIFFVPNFKCFGCTWRVTSPTSFNDKMHFNFVSPRLEAPGKINFSEERLAELNIRPGEQCFAFLTLDFQGPGPSIKPPQWTLDAVEHFHRVNVDPLAPSVLSVSLGASKEWGILLDLVIESEDERNGMGFILCLRDGKFAFGRILKTEGRNDSCWRANVGDTVGFSLIDVDCFNYPVRLALNVIAWQSPAFTSVDSDVLSDQFPQESLPEFPSVRLISKSTGKMVQHLFELCFLIDDNQMSCLRMGSLKVDRLGVLIDLNGDLLSAWSNMKRKGTDAVSSLLLARVRARFSSLPDQQQPLWMVAEMLEIAKIRVDTESKRQILEEPKVTEGNCETKNSPRKKEDGRISSEFQLHEHFSKITVQDGAFGAPISSTRHQKLLQKCSNIASHSQAPTPNAVNTFSSKEVPSPAVVPIANAMVKLGKAIETVESSKGIQPTQQQKQSLEGIVMFTHTKGEEMYWLFYDEQMRHFTRVASAKGSKVLPLLSHQLQPMDGEWFRISYQNHRTMASIAITQIDRLTDLSYLPVHRLNPNNTEIWDKLKEGKFAEVNLWEESTPKSGEKSFVTSQDNAQTTQQQQQRHLRGKTPQPIKRSTPVPVTNVFMRQNDDASVKRQQQNGAGKQQPKVNVVEVNLLPPLLSCSKFFTVQTQLVGIVDYARETSVGRRK